MSEKTLESEADCIVENLRSLFELHPKGSHFCMAEQRSGFALDAESLLIVFDEYDRMKALQFNRNGKDE
jgi:hypothetical protein